VALDVAIAGLVGWKKFQREALGGSFI